jgi:hypothetical protein
MEKKPSELEIYRMHDILENILSEEFPLEIDKPTLQTLSHVLIALCWVLGHDRGNIFLEDMIKLETNLATRGIIFKEIKPNEPSTKP